MTEKNPAATPESFFGEGFFQWQFSVNSDQEQMWEEKQFNPEKYWGGFDRTVDRAQYEIPDWALMPEKYSGNPVFAPDPKSWDCGHFSGGVHNGSVLKKDGLLYYIYRGEMPYTQPEPVNPDSPFSKIDYICDIGVATSRDGIHFERRSDIGPLFRHDGDEKYSFEDVCVVEQDGVYYLYCNRWNWADPVNPRESGEFLAVSRDLLHWEKKGILFPDASEIHRNGCVLQDPDNHPVKVNGKYLMYINNGLLARSEDLIHWESEKIGVNWPGGEGCLALTHLPGREEDIILFTGGHHTGHFYGAGEVLFSPENPAHPKDILQVPALTADETIPYESGRDANPPHNRISSWRDTVFFTGMTLWKDRLYIYYGGSEFYTCLATVSFN